MFRFALALSLAAAAGSTRAQAAAQDLLVTNDTEKSVRVTVFRNAGAGPGVTYFELRPGRSATLPLVPGRGDRAVIASNVPTDPKQHKVHDTARFNPDLHPGRRVILVAQQEDDGRVRLVFAVESAGRPLRMVKGGDPAPEPEKIEAEKD